MCHTGTFDLLKCDVLELNVPNASPHLLPTSACFPEGVKRNGSDKRVKCWGGGVGGLGIVRYIV